MKTLIVHHSMDWDGVMSGAIAKLTLPEADVLGFNYGDQVPTDLDRYDLLVLTDITFPKEVMMEYASKIMLVDHHAPVLKELEGVQFAGYCCDQTGQYSAAYMAWQKFFRHDPMPDIVGFISAYDVFNKTGEYAGWQDAYNFQLGLREKFGLEGMTITTAQDLLHGVIDTSDIIRLGEKFHSFKLREEQDIFSQSWKIKTLSGMEGVAVFSPDMSSLVCEKHLEESGFILLLNRAANGQIKCSLRSKDDGANVQLLAKAFGGGGHVHAAGALINMDVLTDILSGTLPA